MVDVTTLKIARKPVKLQRKIQQDALGKVNRFKEIRRREKDGLKITDNSIMWGMTNLFMTDLASTKPYDQNDVAWIRIYANILR